MQLQLGTLMEIKSCIQQTRPVPIIFKPSSININRVLLNVLFINDIDNFINYCEFL